MSEQSNVTNTVTTLDLTMYSSNSSTNNNKNNQNLVKSLSIDKTEYKCSIRKDKNQKKVKTQNGNTKNKRKLSEVCDGSGT